MDVENNTVRDEDFYFEESEVFVSKSGPIPVFDFPNKLEND